MGTIVYDGFDVTCLVVRYYETALYQCARIPKHGAALVASMQLHDAGHPPERISVPALYEEGEIRVASGPWIFVQARSCFLCRCKFSSSPLVRFCARALDAFALDPRIRAAAQVS